MTHEITCPKVSKNWKDCSHIFQERSLFCWHLKLQSIMHLRHLYFPLFIAIDIKELKFLFNCYMSESATKSNNILEIPIKYSHYLPNPCTYISCLHLFKKLLSFSLRFLLLGWEPNLKPLLEFRYSSVVIKINDSFNRSLEKPSLYSLWVFSLSFHNILLNVSEQMNEWYSLSKGWIRLSFLCSDTSLHFT